MSTHEGVIVYVKKGHIVSEPYVKILLEKNPSCFGCAIIQNGEILTALDKEPVKDLDKAIASVNSLMEDNKDKARVMFFGKYPEVYLEDDIQPYVLLRNSKDEMVVVGFLEGEFPKYHDDDSKHSDAFLCAFKHLMPTLFDRYASSNEDLSKLSKGLGDLHMQLTLESMIGDRGMITLFMATGEILAYKRPNDSNYREFEWGWTSKHFDYKESSFPLQPAATQGRKTFGKSASGIKSTVAPPPSNPAGVQNVPDVKANKSALASSTSVPVVASSQAASMVTLGSPVWVRVLPQYSVKHKSQVKKHFKDFTGACPPNWRDLPIVQVTAPLYVKNPELIPKDLIVPAPGGSTAVEKTTATNVATGSTTTHTVGKEQIPQVVTDSTVMSPDSLIAVANFMKRKDIQEKIQQRKLTIKAQGSAAMLMDPQDIQAQEKKHPSFAQQAGIDLDDTATWTVEQCVALAKDIEGKAGAFGAYRALSILLCNWKAHDLLHRPIAKRETIAAEPPKPAAKRFGQSK